MWFVQFLIAVGVATLLSISYQAADWPDKSTELSRTVAILFVGSVVYGGLYFAGCFDQLVPSIWER